MAIDAAPWTENAVRVRKRRAQMKTSSSRCNEREDVTVAATAPRARDAAYWAE